MQIDSRGSAVGCDDRVVHEDGLSSIIINNANPPSCCTCCIGGKRDMHQTDDRSICLNSTSARGRRITRNRGVRDQNDPNGRGNATTVDG